MADRITEADIQAARERLVSVYRPVISVNEFTHQTIARVLWAPTEAPDPPPPSGTTVEINGTSIGELRDIEIQGEFIPSQRLAGTLFGRPIYIVNDLHSPEMDEADQRAEALLRSYGPEGVALADGNMVTVRSGLFPEITYAISPRAEVTIGVFHRHQSNCGSICILPVEPSPPADVLLCKLLLCKGDERYLWTVGNYMDTLAGFGYLPQLIRDWIAENRRRQRVVVGHAGHLQIRVDVDTQPFELAVNLVTEAMVAWTIRFQENINRSLDEAFLLGDLLSNPSAGRPRGILSGADATIRVMTREEQAKEHARAMLQEQREFVESRQSPAALELPLNIDPRKSRYWFAAPGRRMTRPGPLYASGGYIPAAARAPPASQGGNNPWNGNPSCCR